MPFSSPYNFVPLSNTIVPAPAVGNVFFDVPFKDGYSGTLEFELSTITPVFVGGDRTRQPNQPTRINFCRNNAGQPIIPGATLRGAIRSVLEIVSFSKFSKIDDTRPSLRALAQNTRLSDYKDRLARVEAGFVFRRGAEIFLTHYKFTKISHLDLIRLAPVAPGFPAQTQTVAQKYSAISPFFSIDSESKLPICYFNSTIFSTTNSSPSLESAILVCTRQINGKLNEFLFHTPGKTSVIPTQDWQDFLEIHDPKISRNGSWGAHWSNHFNAGNHVPVFFVDDSTDSKKRFRISLSQLPKLAGDFSTHDAVKKINSGHLTNTTTDFAEAIFGATSKEVNEFSGKSRLIFEPAVFLTSDIEALPISCVLANPKSSFYPAYLDQPNSQPNHFGLSRPVDREILDGGKFVTYLGNAGDPPSLRGWKRYPHRNALGERPQGDRADLRSEFSPLRTASKAITRVTFHNLRKEELGALIYAITWGGDLRCVHKVGLAKPYGLGAIKLKIVLDSSTITENSMHNAIQTTPDKETFLRACKASFTDYIKNKINVPSSTIFETIEQINALKTMAMPIYEASRLRYMTLNEHTTAVSTGLVLGPAICLRSDQVNPTS